MKRYRSITAVLAVILTLGIIVSFVITASYKSDHTDITVINDITETVRENFNDMSALDDMDFSVDFIVFDASGHVVYSRGNSEINHINDAVREGSACMNIVNDGVFCGTVAFPAVYEKSYIKMRNRLILAFAVTGTNNGAMKDTRSNADKNFLRFKINLPVLPLPSMNG